MDVVEEWRPVKGLEGIYEVSNTQRVRSINRVVTCSNGQKRCFGGKEIKPYINTNGYYRVVLRNAGRSEHYYLHRLIAEAFIPNPQNLPQIDHINTVRTDCRVENLRQVFSSLNKAISNFNFRFHNSLVLIYNKDEERIVPRPLDWL